MRRQLTAMAITAVATRGVNGLRSSQRSFGMIVESPAALQAGVSLSLSLSLPSV